MTSMRAAQYATSGEHAGRLEVAEVQAPEPGPGEVLVRVHVAGVNPTDVKRRTAPDTTYPQVTPCQDGAGVVEAVGEGVDPARAGEHVWLFHAQWQRARGAAAELIALPSEQAVAMPQPVSFAQGAGLGIPYVTAHIALHAGGPIAGQAVLVHGGAGAVGHAAIELARLAGARAAATVSSAEKAQLARDAGAELVVNYREQDVAGEVGAWAPDGVSRIVDVDLDANLATDAQVIAPGGVIVDYVGAVSGDAVPGRALMERNASIRFLLVYTTPPAQQLAAAGAIAEALEAGELTALPEHRFPLERIEDAFAAVDGGAVGKVLVEL